MSQTSVPKSKVSKDYHSLETTKLCGFANGINTGVPALNQPTATPPVVPIVTSGTLRGKATSLLNIHSGRQTNPPTSTAYQEDVAKTDLLHNLDKLANQVDTVAEDAAIAAADASAAAAVITGVGFKVAGKSTGMKAHTFKQLKSAKNTVLIQLPSSGKGSVYSIRCGITATEGVIPAAWEPTASISTTELLISGGGLKTGMLVAIQYGVTQHLAASAPPANAVDRAVSSTSTQSTKKKRQIPVYTYGSDPIAWSSHILFAVVQ